MIPLQRDCKGDESSYLCLRIVKKEVERRRLPKRKEGQAQTAKRGACERNRKWMKKGTFLPPLRGKS